MIFLKPFLAILLIGAAVAEPQWYNSSDGRHFLIEGEAKYNWFKASHECSRRHLQLVEIQSEAKNQAIVELLRSVFGQSISLWLGANDLFNQQQDTNRPFYWSSSGQPMTFSFWHTGEPNNERTQEHCLQTFASNPDFKWNDVSCRYQYGFICEDHLSHTDSSAATKEIYQQIKNSMRTLVNTYQQDQEKILKQVNRARSLVQQNDSAVEKFLKEIQTNRGTKKFSAEANHLLNALNEELQESTEAAYNKLSQQFQQVQQSIQRIVANTEK